MQLLRHFLSTCVTSGTRAPTDPLLQLFTGASGEGLQPGEVQTKLLNPMGGSSKPLSLSSGFKGMFHLPSESVLSLSCPATFPNPFKESSHLGQPASGIGGRPEGR